MPDPITTEAVQNSADSTWQSGYAKKNWKEELTKLSPKEEGQFLAWALAKEAPITEDYDMRGFWKDGAAGGAVNSNDGRLHYPDTYKTPLHESFSGESKFADPTTNPPRWNEQDQLVGPDARIYYDERAQPRRF